MSHEDAQLYALQRRIDIRLWRKGKPFPPQLAKKLRLTGRDRKAADNPVTKKIVAQKAAMRRKIASSSQLVEDFEFFTEALGWHPEGLLQHLYWDSNIMHADPRAILAEEKKSTWPIDRVALRAIRKNLRALAEQVERLNKTDLSPAQTTILQNSEGHRLHPADEKYLLRAFRDLPEVLRFYAGELSRKLTLTELYWSRNKKSSEDLVRYVRKTSLYEEIRAKTGLYHAIRLLRLVNISRQVQGFEHIKQRAFIIWLNRLKKRHKELPDLPTTPSPGSSLPS